MFSREEYSQRLSEIALTPEQIEKLRLVLDEMMTSASRKANRAGGQGNVVDEFVAYMEGKADGINAVDRFLRGDMDAHDEFED